MGEDKSIFLIFIKNVDLYKEIDII